MSKKVIIGCGSGRCGTMTLTRLFEAQGVQADHETVGLYWNTKKRLFDRAWGLITNTDADIVANVSFAWLKYIPMAIERDPTVRCVCLKRNREDTVASFSAHFKGLNVWTHHMSPHFSLEHARSLARIRGFPKYDAPREEAIGMYWDDYYRIADEHQTTYPGHFKIFPIESFNSEQGVRSILSFSGFDNPNIEVGIKVNERKHVHTGQELCSEAKAA